MTKKKYNFIKCSDPETIEKLKNLKFQQVGKEGKFAVFLNKSEGQAHFNKSDKVTYSNILAFDGGVRR